METEVVKSTPAQRSNGLLITAIILGLLMGVAGMWFYQKEPEDREAGIIEMDGAQEAQILSADDSDCNADEQIFVASLLSFICLRGEPLKDFKWSFLQNEQNTFYKAGL